MFHRSTSPTRETRDKNHEKLQMLLLPRVSSTQHQGSTQLTTVLRCNRAPVPILSSGFRDGSHATSYMCKLLVHGLRRLAQVQHCSSRSGLYCMRRDGFCSMTHALSLSYAACHGVHACAECVAERLAERVRVAVLK
jgi:hypothetical protein